MMLNGKQGLRLRLKADIWNRGWKGKKMGEDWDRVHTWKATYLDCCESTAELLLSLLKLLTPYLSQACDRWVRQNSVFSLYLKGSARLSRSRTWTLLCLSLFSPTHRSPDSDLSPLPTTSLLLPIMWTSYPRSCYEDAILSGFVETYCFIRLTGLSCPFPATAPLFKWSVRSLMV